VRKHRKLVTALVGFAAAALLIALLARDRQPTYQGQRLSALLEIYGSHPDDPQVAANAENALRHIGTNAIPFLLQWISYEPSPLRTKLDSLIEKVPDRWRPRWMDSPGSRSFDAAVAFAVLGAAGSNAIPHLTKQAVTATNEQGTQRATIALSGIGPQALPALLEMTTNSHTMIRYFAIAAISTLGQSASPALPRLIKSLDDPQVEVSCCAADALGRLALDPATSIPALTNLLTNADPARRAYAARGLGGFAQAARPAARHLQNALLDPDGWPQDEARRALDAIAPEMLTNSPAQ
jgi:HEAT repeat protein